MDKDTIRSYYAGGVEKERLVIDKLEGIRSKEIIQRYLPSNPINIIDIGGATGFYSFWLAEMGHRVTLFDLTPENIEAAKTFSTVKDQQIKNICRRCRKSSIKWKAMMI